MNRYPIRRHPQDCPFTSEEVAALTPQLPDPETADVDRVSAMLDFMMVMTPPIEIPNDAQGLPPPPMEAVPMRLEFVRRRDVSGEWYWLCLS